MINLHLPLIGPAVVTLATVRQLPKLHDRFAVLLHGDPGIAKSHLLDLFAQELTGSKFAIEQVNGQDVDIARVRQWRDRGACGNLFSPWTVKRIDELDKASDAAQAALLTWLDYLPAKIVILATTNNYRQMVAVDKGRLQRRFKQFLVEAPSVTEAIAYLCAQFGIPRQAAEAIARGAVPDGQFDGVNMGAAVEDAQGFQAAHAAKTARQFELAA